MINNAQDKVDEQCTSSGYSGCDIPISVTIGNSIGPDGKLIAPETAAKRIFKILSDARRGGSDPIGAIVSVDIELSGLRGQEIALSWSMWQSASKNRLHGAWLNNNLAYVLRPTTDSDTGTFDIWVPLPKAPGPYFVRADLSLNRSGLASASSETFQ